MFRSSTALIAVLLPCSAFAQPFDIVLANGRVINGNGDRAPLGHP